MNSLDFQPYQIVCLECDGDRLYAEVIQIVQSPAKSRQLAWVRPLMLVMGSLDDASDELPILHDLRQGADLLWPLDFFRIALDTEIIPFLGKLEPDSASLQGSSPASKQLSSFVRQVWQTRQADFGF